MKCDLTPLQMAACKRILAMPEFELLRGGEEPCDCDRPSKRKRKVCCYHTPMDIGASESEAIIWSRFHRNGQGCHNCPNCMGLVCVAQLLKLSNHMEVLKVNPRDPPEIQAYAARFARQAFDEDVDAVGGVHQVTTFRETHAGLIDGNGRLARCWWSFGWCCTAHYRNLQLRLTPLSTIMKLLMSTAVLLVTSVCLTVAQDPTAAGSTAGVSQAATTSIEPPMTTPPGVPAPVQDQTTTTAAPVTNPAQTSPVDASPALSPIGSSSGDGSSSTGMVVTPRRRKSHVTAAPSPSPGVTKDTSAAVTPGSGLAFGSLGLAMILLTLV